MCFASLELINAHDDIEIELLTLFYAVDLKENINKIISSCCCQQDSSLFKYVPKSGDNFICDINSWSLLHDTLVCLIDD